MPDVWWRAISKEGVFGRQCQVADAHQPSGVDKASLVLLTTSEAGSERASGVSKGPRFYKTGRSSPT